MLALEVGKNRMEALGEAQETADLIAYYCDQMEANDGYVRAMARDPLPGFVSENTSVLKPHGAWLVIAPFNFPFALAGGPVGAALVAGNTVVLKPASSTTPWSARLLALALRDAGVPPGVFNLVTGPGGRHRRGADPSTPTSPASRSPGATRSACTCTARSPQRRWPRPCIAEMGGKNAAIVSRHANLHDAVTGIVRSAFGLSGQKCSACSRVYVEHTVFADFVAALHGATAKVAVGDPTRREHWMGPVIDAAAVARYEDAAAQVQALGADGGDRRTAASGSTAATSRTATSSRRPSRARRSTIRCGRTELFAAVRAGGAGDDVDEGIARANASDYGLTAGFYGSADETERFFADDRGGRVPTRTGRRARRRARGRATSRSAAGRARARPARPAARSTTCRSTCASSRRRASRAGRRIRR